VAKRLVRVKSGDGGEKIYKGVWNKKKTEPGVRKKILEKLSCVVRGLELRTTKKNRCSEGEIIVWHKYPTAGRVVLKNCQGVRGSGGRSSSDRREESEVEGGVVKEGRPAEGVV